jgi:hypothetical protein
MKIILIGAENLTPSLLGKLKYNVSNIIIDISFQHNNGKFLKTGALKNGEEVLKFVPEKKRYTKCLLKLSTNSGQELHYSATVYINKKANFNRRKNCDAAFTKLMSSFIFQDTIFSKAQRTKIWDQYWMKSPKTMSRSKSHTPKMSVVRDTEKAA